MSKEKNYLIAGIGTDIGKTYLLENLIKNLITKKLSVLAIKPVISGFINGDLNSDTAKILQAIGLEINSMNIDSISPWRFELAASPHIASQQEGQEIEFDEVKDFCLSKIVTAKNNDEYLFIETAGGIMTPITDNKTFLDLAAKLNIPVLLLSTNYLGSISHTLCAVEALKQKGLKIENIILNNHIANQNSYISEERFLKDIENFTKIKTISINDFVKTFLD